MTTNAHPSSARYQFFMTSDSGRVCDLSQLLADGAKLTVLFRQLCHDWGISAREKWAYHRLRRQLQKWADSGLVEYSRYVVNSCSVEPEERPGVFCRAVQQPRIKTPNLIKRLQNSKSVAAPQNERIFPDEEPPKYNWLPGGRISWLRIQAIRKLQRINDPALFVRQKGSDGKSRLNPKLTQAQKEISKMFEVWKRDVSRKNIVMRDKSAGGKYLILDYKTRFTDAGRHWQNEKTYRNAVKKSLEMYDDGLFITLTSDPQIHMRPLGSEFARHVNDPLTGKTYEFELEGQGGSLWTANRNESKAFRRWYERMCHRFECRPPYIRVVEFQKNGLIHTHLLLFGVDGEYWDKGDEKQFDWETLARDWGERYNQGIMNQVYRIKNINGVWEWANKGEQPDDTHGRRPADYLGKYLKKASDIPTIKCECGEICSSASGDDIICPKCGRTHKAPRDGRYMYWVMGKRFFTISQCLREYDFDAEILKEDLKRIAPEWEFIGSPDASETTAYILRDAKKKHIHMRLSGDGWENKPPAEPEQIREKIRRKFKREEEPDINDDIPRIEELPQVLTDEQAAAIIEITTAEENYNRLLELEREERRKRREELKCRKELKK